MKSKHVTDQTRRELALHVIETTMLDHLSQEHVKAYIARDHVGCARIEAIEAEFRTNWLKQLRDAVFAEDKLERQRHELPVIVADPDPDQISDAEFNRLINEVE